MLLVHFFFLNPKYLVEWLMFFFFTPSQAAACIQLCRDPLFLKAGRQTNNLQSWFQWWVAPRQEGRIGIQLSQTECFIYFLIFKIMEYSNVTCTMNILYTTILYKELILSFAIFPLWVQTQLEWLKSDTMFEPCLWPCYWSTSVKIMIH